MRLVERRTGDDKGEVVGLDFGDSDGGTEEEAVLVEIEAFTEAKAPDNTGVVEAATAVVATDAETVEVDEDEEDEEDTEEDRGVKVTMVLEVGVELLGEIKVV